MFRRRLQKRRTSIWDGGRSGQASFFFERFFFIVHYSPVDGKTRFGFHDRNTTRVTHAPSGSTLDHSTEIVGRTDVGHVLPYFSIVVDHGHDRLQRVLETRRRRRLMMIVIVVLEVRRKQTASFVAVVETRVVRPPFVRGKYRGDFQRIGRHVQRRAARTKTKQTI